VLAFAAPTTLRPRSNSPVRATLERMFRVAHISDLHVLDLTGVPLWRFLNKRVTGYANLRFKRSHSHRTETLRAVCREVKKAKVDHLVITGDITNLALETEFEAARTLLAEELDFAPENVSLVPGNHDTYTRGAAAAGRVSQYFSSWMKTDLACGEGPFPFVHLRGPLALVGLSTAVPQPPLMACGSVSDAQLDALRRIHEAPELKGRGLLYLMHHPLFDLGKDQFSKGLQHQDRIRASLVPGVLCHGHLHTRIAASVKVPGGTIASYGATSASLNHENPRRMAGLNLYEFDASGTLQQAFAVTSNGERRDIPKDLAPAH
jgi:3',5'-cyclic AMP phosphodiesterase CpdA